MKSETLKQQKSQTDIFTSQKKVPVLSLFFDR